MGNTSSAPSVSQIIKFDELPVEEQNDLRGQIVAKIREAYNERVKRNTEYIPIDVKAFKYQIVKNPLYLSDTELYKMCKTAIPVPFVVHCQDFNFWVVLVANSTVTST